MNPSQCIEPSSRLRRGFAIGIALFSLLLLFALGSWAWLLRDGLGPDSIESSGTEAFLRFFSYFWPGALLCLVLFVIAFFIGRHQTSS